MNLPYYRPFVVSIDGCAPIEVSERTAAGAAIGAAVQLIPRAERRGWPDTAQYHVAHVLALALAPGWTITDIAVWFDLDGHPRTYTPGETP